MTLKSQREIAFMRKAGQITRGALKAGGPVVSVLGGGIIEKAR